MVDRDELLARTDLASLADELLGGRKGNGRSAMWPSPVRTHSQTGKTPPMHIFTDHGGTERWKCFATGATGTAIDLVMERNGDDLTAAFEFLANRAGLARAGTDDWNPPPVTRTRPSSVSRPVGDPHPAFTDWIAQTEQLLWSPEAADARHWLTARGLGNKDLLKAAHVGFDPGVRHLPRHDDLPKRTGVVFPLLDNTGQPTYAQVRTLRTEPIGDRPLIKYLGVKSEMAAHPGVGTFHAPGPRSGVVVVTEGVADSLSAVSAGFEVSAVLGIGIATTQRVTDHITNQARNRPVVIAFDAEPQAQTAARELRAALVDRNLRASVMVPLAPDLNEWLRRTRNAGRHFGAELSSAVTDTITASHARPARNLAQGIAR